MVSVFHPIRMMKFLKMTILILETDKFTFSCCYSVTSDHYRRCLEDFCCLLLVPQITFCCICCTISQPEVGLGFLYMFRGISYGKSVFLPQFKDPQSGSFRDAETILCLSRSGVECIRPVCVCPGNTTYWMDDNMDCSKSSLKPLKCLFIRFLLQTKWLFHYSGVKTI